MRWVYYFLCLLALLVEPKIYSQSNIPLLMDLDLINSKNVRVLQDLDYQNLKARVLRELEHSWCSQEKGRLIMDLVVLGRPSICVEIGVFSGATLLPIAAVLKFLGEGDVYAIDPWSNQEATMNMEMGDPNRAWWLDVDFDAAYRSFQALLLKWQLSPFCHVMRLTSDKAIKYIKTIDFLHLDGDYSAQGSIRDVELYLPKVPKGGYTLLSNLLLTVHDEQPKMAALDRLLDYCEIIHELDHGNSLLLRKIID